MHQYKSFFVTVMVNLQNKTKKSEGKGLLGMIDEDNWVKREATKAPPRIQGSRALLSQ